jgi:hypothetical protein
VTGGSANCHAAMVMEWKQTNERPTARAAACFLYDAKMTLKGCNRRVASRHASEARPKNVLEERKQQEQQDGDILPFYLYPNDRRIPQRP